MAKSVALYSSVALIKHIFLASFFKKIDWEKWLIFFGVRVQKTVVRWTNQKGKKVMPDNVGNEL